MIKSGLSYSINDLSSNIEALTAQIVLKGRRLTIVNMYVPPNSEFIAEEYRNLISKPNSLIVGDFNSYSPLWGANKTDQRGKALEDLIEQYNLCILNNGQGTHIKHRGGLSPIDLSLASNNLALKCNWRVSSDSLGSDHYPILISIDEPPVREEVDVTKYSFRKADWGRFKSHCKSLSLESVANENLAT